MQNAVRSDDSEQIAVELGTSLSDRNCVKLQPVRVCFAAVSFEPFITFVRITERLSSNNAVEKWERDGLFQEMGNVCCKIDDVGAQGAFAGVGSSADYRRLCSGYDAVDQSAEHTALDADATSSGTAA
jgi:hypothetical protein